MDAQNHLKEISENSNKELEICLTGISILIKELEAKGYKTNYNKFEEAIMNAVSKAQEYF